MVTCALSLGGGLSPNTKPKGFSESELYLDNSYPKKTTPTTEKATPVHMKSLPLHLVDSQMSGSQSVPVVSLLEPVSRSLNMERPKAGSGLEVKKIDSNSTSEAVSDPVSEDEGEVSDVRLQFICIQYTHLLTLYPPPVFPPLTCHTFTHHLSSLYPPLVFPLPATQVPLPGIIPIPPPLAFPLPATCLSFTCHLPSLYPPLAFPLPATCLPFTRHLPSLYPPLAFPLPATCLPFTRDLPSLYPQLAFPLPATVLPFTQCNLSSVLPTLYDIALKFQRGSPSWFQ